MSNPHLRHLHRAQRLAKLLDSRFQFFGFRFGLDSVFGLIPGIGDVIGLLFALYIIWIARQLQLPTHKQLQMVFWVLLDAGIGAIPLIGDLSDVFFKANLRNLQLIDDHYYRHLVLEGEVVTETEPDVSPRR